MKRVVGIILLGMAIAACNNRTGNGVTPGDSTNTITLPKNRTSDSIPVNGTNTTPDPVDGNGKRKDSTGKKTLKALNEQELL